MKRHVDTYRRVNPENARRGVSCVKPDRMSIAFRLSGRSDHARPSPYTLYFLMNIPEGKDRIRSNCTLLDHEDVKDVLKRGIFNVLASGWPKQPRTMFGKKSASRIPVLSYLPLKAVPESPGFD